LLKVALNTIIIIPIPQDEEICFVTCYIMAVSVIGGRNRSTRRKVTDNLITYVLSSTSRLGAIRTHNVNGDRDWLDR
jgi:hypothetical protein